VKLDQRAHRNVAETGWEMALWPLPSAALIALAYAIVAWAEGGPEPDVRGWRYDPNADPRHQEAA
jgi:hypothetical protein